MNFMTHDRDGYHLLGGSTDTAYTYSYCIFEMHIYGSRNTRNNNIWLLFSCGRCWFLLSQTMSDWNIEIELQDGDES